MRHVVTLTATLLVACTSVALAQTSSPGDPLQTLSTGLQNGDAKTVARAYAEDAVLLPPGSRPVRGRAALEAFWKAQFESGFALLDGGSSGSATSGDLSYEWGYVTLGGASGGDSQYVNVLRKDEQGSWRVVLTTWNSSEAAGQP